MRSPTTRIPEFEKPRMPVSFGAGLTHVGRVRERNEDSILTDPTGALWAVADGMGGHGFGDVASDVVIERLSTAPDDGDPTEFLSGLLRDANAELYARARGNGGAVMGATVVTMMIQNAVGYIAWVGDSRAYLMRGGRLRLLTRDHTLVQSLVDDGLVAEEDARDHPQGNIVTRAVGAEEILDVDTVSVPLVAGDRVVMCSDGLTACLADQEIETLLAGARDPEEATRALISASLDKGAPDNVSVIVVFLEELPR